MRFRANCYASILIDRFPSQMHPEQGSVRMTFRKGTILKTTFEEYQITKQIGAGGAGKVYAVTDIGGDRYAIKVLDG